jgi:hypothetical protein
MIEFNIFAMGVTFACAVVAACLGRAWATLVLAALEPFKDCYGRRRPKGG